MKVYLVWKITYHTVHSQDTLVAAYSTRSRAEEHVAQLRSTNFHPVVTDYYGPLSGTDYSSLEVEVLD
jgi:hypothetical protein